MNHVGSLLIYYSPVAATCIVLGFAKFYQVTKHVTIYHADEVNLRRTRLVLGWVTVSAV